MARPRKSLENQLGHRTKEEKEIRKFQEEESRVGRNLEPPKWLNKNARDIFNLLVVELNEKELLDNLDIPLLAIYSDSYARVQELTKKIDVEGYIVEREKGIAKNPNLDTLKIMQKTVLDYAVRLGLNSIDRTKLINYKPKNEEVDPFEPLLKQNGIKGT